MNTFGNFPLVVDLIGEACRPDCDRDHANNEPKHQRSPPEFGGGDNPDSKGEYANGDQICGELLHAQHSSLAANFRSSSTGARRPQRFFERFHDRQNERIFTSAAQGEGCISSCSCGSGGGACSLNGFDASLHQGSNQHSELSVFDKFDEPEILLTTNDLQGARPLPHVLFDFIRR
jgi:hypothetical protein